MVKIIISINFLQEQNNNIVNKDRVQDRMKYLEEREKRLEKESHELREQNELLEFRILELEENQDKVSGKINSCLHYFLVEL
jgi:hypothetical protein